MSEEPTMLLPRVGDDPPQWPSVDRDLPPLVVCYESSDYPPLLVLERVLSGLRDL